MSIGDSYVFIQRQTPNSRRVQYEYSEGYFYHNGDTGAIAVNAPMFGHSNGSLLFTGNESAWYGGIISNGENYLACGGGNTIPPAPAPTPAYLLTSSLANPATIKFSTNNNWAYIANKETNQIIWCSVNPVSYELSNCGDSGATGLNGPTSLKLRWSHHSPLFRL